MNKVLSIAIDADLSSFDPLTELILEQKTKLFNFIKKRVPDKEDAEDILQEVFYLLIETSKSVKKIEHLTAWLFKIAKNKIVDLYRKKKPIPFSSIDSFEDRERLGGLEHLERSENIEIKGGGLSGELSNPESLMEKKEFLTQFEDVLEQLPAKQKEVFIWNEMEGLSFKEISKRTGISVNTLLSRKHYAILFLRKRLKQFQESTP